MKKLLILTGILFSLSSFAQESITVDPSVVPFPEKEPFCALLSVPSCEGSEDDLNNRDYLVVACENAANASVKTITEYICEYGTFPENVTFKRYIPKNVFIEF